MVECFKSEQLGIQGGRMQETTKLGSCYAPHFKRPMTNIICQSNFNLVLIVTALR